MCGRTLFWMIPNATNAWNVENTEKEKIRGET
jgi:hypothetical protein